MRGVPGDSGSRVDGGSGSDEGLILVQSASFIANLLELSPHCEVLRYALPDDGIEIRFHRWTPDKASAQSAFLLGTESSGMKTDRRLGTVVTADERADDALLWSPPAVVVGGRDSHGRLIENPNATVESWWEWNPQPIFHLGFEGPEGSTVYWPMVVFGDRVATARELLHLDEIESTRALKSDWFDASSVADLWSVFVDGTILDPCAGDYGRFPCQQCAYAWWSYLVALHRHSDKKVYRALARAIAWSLRLDLASDGLWHHGMWNADPETHTRMVWDGVRLLVAEHEESGQTELLELATEVSGRVVETLSEETRAGSRWFLHDSEQTPETIRARMPVIGRSAGNPLVLNTHVQALCVLIRLVRAGPVTSEPEVFGDVIDAGLRALVAALSLPLGSRALTVLDGRLRSAIECKFPRDFPERLQRFVLYRVFPPIYWFARNRSTGLVFPSGYIDRDLGRTMLADEYHVVNLKDLVELDHLDRRSRLGEVIDRAVRFSSTLDFERSLERSQIWAEWVDVLLLERGRGDGTFIAARDQVIRSLGGEPLDTFCAAFGVGCLGGIE